MGQALVRELLKSDTERIVIFSRDEFKQYRMKLAISDERLRFFLGDVRDLQRLRRAFQDVDCVIHAAALKQVEAVEFNPFEAVKTNIIGSQNVIEAALDCGVRKVLAISTDKAAAPSSLYGATKLCSERIFLAAKSYAGGGWPLFSVARFGNIAGSRGSVIPKWRELLKVQDWVPVTDLECTRYWITQEDAACFAIEKLHWMIGGELSQPEMPAFRIGDLAHAMEAKIRVVGLGVEERLHEDGSDQARRMTVSELRECLGVLDLKRPKLAVLS